MRPLPTPLFLCALRLLLPLAACGWAPAIASPKLRAVSAYWNNRDSPVHIFTSSTYKGFHLAICPNGKVERSIFQSPYSALIMKAISPGYISFIGAKSKLNLCMRPDGNLFGTPFYHYGACVFRQIRLETNYDAYESFKHKILLSLGGGKGPYVPNMKLPRFTAFITRKNEVPIDEIYPPAHQ